MLKKVIKAGVKLLSANIIVAGLSFLAMPLLVAKIGIDGFGEFVLYQTAIMLVFKLCNPQSWQAVSSIIYGYELKDRFSVIQSAISIDIVCTFLSILLGIFVYLFFCNWLNFLSIDLINLILCLAMLPCLQTGGLSSIYRLENRYFILAISDVSSASLKCLLIYLMSEGAGLTEVLAIYLISEVLKFSILLLPIFHQIIFFEMKKIKIIVPNLIKQIKWTWWGGIVDLPVNELDKLIVGYFLNMESVGLYQIIRRIGSIINIAASPLYQVLYPEAMKAAIEKNYMLIKSLIVKFSLMMFLCGALAFSFIYTTSSLWQNFFSGELNEYSIQLILIYIVIQWGVIVFIHYHPIFTALNGVRANAILTMVLNLLFTILFISGIYAFGIEGGLLAILIHYFATVFIKAVCINNKLKVN